MGEGHAAGQGLQASTDSQVGSSPTRRLSSRFRRRCDQDVARRLELLLVFHFRRVRIVRTSERGEKRYQVIYFRFGKVGRPESSARTVRPEIQPDAPTSERLPSGSRAKSWRPRRKR